MAVFIEIQLNGVFFKHCKECVLCENRLNYILAMALKLRIHYMNSIEQKNWFIQTQIVVKAQTNHNSRHA